MLKKFIYSLIIAVIMALTPLKTEAGVVLVYQEAAQRDSLMLE